jgi:hypothetical protein
MQLPVQVEGEPLANVRSRGHEEMIMRPAVAMEFEHEHKINEELSQDVSAERVETLRRFPPRGDVSREGDREKPAVIQTVSLNKLEDVFPERIDPPPLRCRDLGGARFG